MALFDLMKQNKAINGAISQPSNLFIEYMLCKSYTTVRVAGLVAQSVARLTQEPEAPSPIPCPDTYFFPPSADLRSQLLTKVRALRSG